MENLIVLAGPILRRVEKKSISIWVATSRSFQIKAALFNLADGSLLPTWSETESVRVGEKLFIHLVQVYGDFPMDTLLGYDLTFAGHGEFHDLASLGYLSEHGAQSIVYPGIPYPSFHLPESSSPNFLYASCRKFHGKGEDSLTAGDELLHTTASRLQERPSALFLVGDQIYADDVASPLFPVIRTIASNFIGEEELSRLDHRLEQHPFHRSLYNVNGRQFIMEQFCRFTSSNPHNHLMTFGEYAAMYLLSWSPALWETVALPSFDELVEKDEFHFIFPDDEKEKDQQRRNYERQTEDLLQTIGDLRRIRRLLANMPTYMIFDDHDVTDDWNLTADWRDHVSRSPLGKHVVTNGLCAYWAFQGWGNEPQRYEEAFLQSMRNYFDRLIVGTPAHTDWMDCIWSFRHWHFVAPTRPAALFLNTRTMRFYDANPLPVKIGWIYKENIRGPRLIGPAGWKAISSTLHASGWKRGDPLTIISPTPLYGMGIIESFLHSYVYPLRSIGIPVHEMLDFEAWKYNGKAFNEFLRHIVKWRPSRCIILSGDVHYASAVHSRIRWKNGFAASILQVTSSPSNNMSFSGLWGLLMRAAIRWNSNKRKGVTIRRHCDDSFNIRNGGSEPPCDAPWQEELYYVSKHPGSSIVETGNNIGQLIIGENAVQPALLQMKGGELRKVTFEEISI
ncbi:hypothetical protein OXB_0777 [Bacillus sp. OxB-1]|uniref:hypothetical protein n=1 Tax=Bacillus sp. (strain OxB-1) TaxID=98228 RepID=UPI000581CBBA|nr:hypothetical protein [Bacillus sp. OxB-1]BAQ09249.1 hypothetical protein OXB_0777 [Bacillus sp. OxB-1]